MKLEMEFHGSKISEVKSSAGELEIVFSHVVIICTPESSAKPKTTGVTAAIKIGGYKCKKLPKEGVLSDGELYGIPNKALNGRIAVDFAVKRDCELEITIDHIDYTITGKSFQIHVDMNNLPDEFRH
ncbi:MAG: hypothetical protein V4655_00175 [Bdellovibrionota bacterium]|nr:MAG: hypothetical protein EOP10_17315 [Pseudomonadota bacterium]